MNNITKITKDDKYSTTIINFIYELQIKKDELLSLTFLADLLIKTNNKYKNEIIFNKEKLKNYIMLFNSGVNVVKNNYFLNFSLVIPNTNLIKEKFLKDAITFVLDSIYNPFFNELSFDKKKRIYTETLLKAKKNIGYIAEEHMIELIDKDGTLNKFKYKDLDYIKNICLEDIINVYNTYLKNIKPKIFVDGNLDRIELNEILDNYYNQLNLKNYKVNKDFINLHKYEDFTEKRDSASFYQSVVYMVYKVINLTESDIYKLYLINLILSSNSSNLLLNVLRKQNNLVYSCGSSVLFKNGILVVKALTSKKNIDNVIKIVNMIFDSFNSIEKYEENINDILYRLYLNTERKKDIQVSGATDNINKYFGLDNDLKTELDILSNITNKDMIDVVKRLKLSNIYVLEGDLEYEKGNIK